MRSKSFLKAAGGQFSIMLALTLPVLIGATALALDVSTMVSAKSKLQNALDAAVLASSRLRDQTMDRQDVFQDFLATNLVNDREFMNVEGSLQVEDGLNRIETTATAEADVKLTFAQYFGARKHIRVDAAAYESANSIEVAMVLDNTGSMGAARMKSLRDAATELVKILEATSGVNREVRAALVPFVTAVNVKGEGYKEEWIDTKGKAPYNGANFELNGSVPYSHIDLFKALKVDWKGCVEARPVPNNLDDTPPDPSKPATLFVPYFAPDNPGVAATSPNSGTDWNNSYLTDSNRAVPVKKSLLSEQQSVARYFDASVARVIGEQAPRTTGPNYACPSPIMPLTSDFTKLRAEIARMDYWEGSGTNVSEGLAWGMRVLSPGEPYTQGAAFDDETVSKAVVVFTDGENTVFGASDSGKIKTDAKHLPFNQSDYGSYNFIDSGRTGTTNRSTSLSNINGWTQTMCTRLKNNKVRVFTVVLGADTTANRALYSACASSPADYYPTSDVSQLKDVFKKIGASVAKLYLTQ